MKNAIDKFAKFTTKTLSDFFNKFKSYDTDSKLIVILAISLFSHYIITIITIICIALFVLIKRDITSMIKKMMSARALLLFSGYLLFVSIIYQNWLGALISVGLFFVFVVVIYYRTYINRDLFETILNVMIFLSVVCIIMAILEQSHYVFASEHVSHFFDIANQPRYRVSTMFYNANYYAMMILFVQAFCVYKIIDSRKNRNLYIMIALLNILPLYLTGSRVIWVGLFLTWLSMFAVSGKKPAIIATLSFGGLTVVSTLLEIPIIPRLLEFGTSLDRREVIFNTAFIMMRDTWLFGQGPLTYLHIHPEYLDDYIARFGVHTLNRLGIETQHTHSMFIEPFVSFGVIGTSFFGIYMFAQFRRIWHLYKTKLNRSLVTLIVGSIFAVVSANIIDFSIFWVQTGTLFLLILGSSDMYRKQFMEQKLEKAKQKTIKKA